MLGYVTAYQNHQLRNHFEREANNFKDQVDKLIQDQVEELNSANFQDRVEKLVLERLNRANFQDQVEKLNTAKDDD